MTPTTRSSRVPIERSAIVFLFLILCGCNSFGATVKDTFKDRTPWGLWDHTEIGELQGVILLQWVGQNERKKEFIYIPDERNPLTFKRMRNKKVVDTIVLDRKFYTDGGSIPRPAQVTEDFSPWKFAPAYLIHDWLFELNHCDLPGAERYNHEIAAQILAEVIKTQMELSKDDASKSDKYLLYDIFSPVRQYSKDFWKKRTGRCDLFDDGYSNTVHESATETGRRPAPFGQLTEGVTHQHAPAVSQESVR